MRLLNFRNKSESGGVFVEFALVVPLLLFMVFLLFDLGQRQYYRTLFSAAVEKATSHAAVVPNLEYVDVNDLDNEDVILETKAKALALLEGSGIPVHLDAWQGGADFENTSNPAAPAWAWVNKLDVILPTDPQGVKSLADMLASEPIIMEVEGFYSRTLTGFGPARFSIRRATYREISQTASDVTEVDAEAPCPGAIDNRYGFADGQCFCRLDGTGLTDAGGGCDCAVAAKNYNPATSQCECAAAPANAQVDSDTCDVSCTDYWQDLDGEAGCETCSGPHTSDNPIPGMTCSCPNDMAQLCKEMPGQFDGANCTCTPCPGAAGNEDRYLQTGNCTCKPAAELCPGNLVPDSDNGCQCGCPNAYFDLVGEGDGASCVCDVDGLAATCGDAEFVDPDLCACTGCNRLGAVRDSADSTTCSCACPDGQFSNDTGFGDCPPCITCEDPSFDGDFTTNPDYSTSGGEPCLCDLECAGDDEYLDNISNGTQGGTCNCVECPGEFDSANEDNDACECDPALLYEECVTNQGPGNELGFDPGTACGCTTACEAPFTVDATTGDCVCDLTEDTANCADGETFMKTATACGCYADCDWDANTDDWGAPWNTCGCNHLERYRACAAQELTYGHNICACREPCDQIDPTKPDFQNGTYCWCDPVKNAQRCAEMEPPQAVDSATCGCNGTCSGTTPDLVDGECVCARNWAIASCNADQYFDTNSCSCQSCGDNATPGNDANHSCICDPQDCSPGMNAFDDGNGTSCTCACPPGTVELDPSFSPGNVCMPLSDTCPAIGDCRWDGTGWVPVATE